MLLDNTELKTAMSSLFAKDNEDVSPKLASLESPSFD